MNKAHKFFVIALLMISGTHKRALSADEAIVACASPAMLERLDPALQVYAQDIQKALDPNNINGITLQQLLKALAKVSKDQSFEALQNASVEEIVAHIRTQIDRFPLYLQEQFAQLTNEDLTLAVNEAYAWERFEELLNPDKAKVAPYWPTFVDDVTTRLQGTRKQVLANLCATLQELRNKGALGVGKGLKPYLNDLPAHYQQLIKSLGWGLVKRISHNKAAARRHAAGRAH
jgi:hypothetical protein